jgi:hypothetical protein
MPPEGGAEANAHERYAHSVMQADRPSCDCDPIPYRDSASRAGTGAHAASIGAPAMGIFGIFHQFAGEILEKSRSPHLHLSGYPNGWMLMELPWRLGTTSVAAGRILPFAW